MTPITHLRPLHYRSIWISDLHLGSRSCQADFLLDFLLATHCKTLYLVGDIFDLWAMKKGLYWPQSHNHVLRTLLDKARNGTQLVYLPGNHDEHFRSFLGAAFGNVQVAHSALHLTANGQRLLVLHGDDFDHLIQNGRWLATLGSQAYDILIGWNRRLGTLRRALGLPYWSLASTLKRQVKNATNYIGRFERTLAQHAQQHHVDGIICGHIHHPALHHLHHVLYCNCGDWVENCTALVEHHDGQLELLHWTHPLQLPLTQPPLARAG